MRDRYVRSIDKKKILYIDAHNLYGHSMSEPLPYRELKFDNYVKIEDILNTPDDSDNGYFIEVDLKYPDNKRQKKTKYFPYCPEKKSNRKRKK